MYKIFQVLLYIRRSYLNYLAIIGGHVGSRTPVQKSVYGPSTSLVHVLYSSLSPMDRILRELVIWNSLDTISHQDYPICNAVADVSESAGTTRCSTQR